jgi:DNA repair exonuclease SbcCD ATPase subunit
MRIKQVTIRNYRLHQDITVDFHPKLQLIGGRNESGKSTVVEAIHRCLFLRAKGQTAEHRAMAPRNGSAAPEVELLFESGGKKYRIYKKFDGNKGVVEFGEVGGSPLSSDPADDAIGRLLGTKSGVAPSALASSWAHLWIEQGQSFNDPTAPAKLPAEQLNARLRTLGGTALSSSNKDAALAKHFREEKAEIFKATNGDFKDGCAAGKAQKAMRDAELSFNSAKDNLEKIRHAIDGLEQARQDSETTKPLLTQQQAEADILRSQLLEFTRLDAELKGEITQTDSALRKLQELQRITADIETTKAALATAEKNALPEKEKILQADEAYLAAVTKYEFAKSELSAAKKVLEIARNIEELVLAHQSRSKLEQDLAEAKAGAVEIDKLKGKLATLPEITEKDFKALQKADKEASAARFALEALSARVKLVAGPQGIKVGSSELKAGEDLLIAQPTLIITKDGTQIQFSPGGEDLPGLQKNAEETTTKLTELLLKHRVGSFAEAERARAERSGIEQTIEIKTNNKGAKGDGLDPNALKQVNNSISALEASLQRMGGAPPKVEKDLPALSAQVSGLKNAAKAAKGEVDLLETKADAAENARDAADEALRLAREKLGEAEKALSGLKIRLDLLQQTYPTSAELTAAIADQTKALVIAENKQQGTKNALAKLPPDLDLAIERLDRAISVTRTKQQNAEREAIQFQAQARANGVNDPSEQFELLRAEYERAQQAFHSASDQANAIKLLADTFKSATQALDAQYTQPLLERVGVYLASMFEHGARLELKKEGDGFTEPTLVRPNSKDPYPTPFESLSGGAKEQVATAIRLATAEILAENFGGTLPIVFDDAFAFTDRQRVQQVIRMLDLGANRGLQIILLSCTHEDYANLGAQEYVIK